MLPGGLRVWVALAPVNMSKSIDGLAAAVAQELSRDPKADGVFVFVNRRRDRVKLLWKDPSGWCLLYKRLDSKLMIGNVDAEPSSTATSIDGRMLASLLAGVASSRKSRAKDIAKKSRTQALSLIQEMPTTTT